MRVKNTIFQILTDSNTFETVGHVIELNKSVFWKLVRASQQINIFKEKPVSTKKKLNY